MVRTATELRLGQVLQLVAPALPARVDAFYDALASQPGPNAVMERLTPAEHTHLRARQCEHVLAVLAAVGAADLEVVHRASNDIGRVHAMVGVELEWFVQALIDLQQAILEMLRPHASELDLTSVHSALSERFMSDLHAVVTGYREVDQAEHEALVRITAAVGDAATVADLCQGVLDELAGLAGVSACFLARPRPDGGLEFEVGAGEAVGAFAADAGGLAAPITADPDSPRGNGPSGRAWRSGSIERSDAYQLDSTTEPWWTIGKDFGFRSSVAIPLMDDQGRPRAVVSMYAAWPGYFATDRRQSLLQQLKQLFERKLVELEDRPAASASVTGYAERVSHQALLAAGAVTMAFQPVVDLRTGTVVKFEALARLEDVDGRLLPPGRFLPSLGTSQLVRLYQLGLDQALAALEGWTARGCAAGVSVNLPMGATDDDRYLAVTKAALGRSGVDPAHLTLELLETGAGDGDLATTRRALDALKALGVRLAQDDLGAGYSSLLRLRHFAFDEVKIDRELVVASNDASRSFLRFIQPITDIAHGLGLAVIAEGLETVGLVEAAAHLGVDAGQGYGIARPMPVEAVAGWLDGFRLDVHPSRARTPLGALAGHVAWEHRIAALHGDPARDAIAGLECCALTDHLAAGPADAETRAAHEHLHQMALERRGGEAHQIAWTSLVARLASSPTPEGD